MKNKLQRRYGRRQLHFVTCGCHRRRSLLGRRRRRAAFLRILNEARERHQFLAAGVRGDAGAHSLADFGATGGHASTVMQALQQRVAQCLRRKPRRRRNKDQMDLWSEA